MRMRWKTKIASSQNMYFAVVVLVSVVVWTENESLGAAVWGIALIYAADASTRKQKTRGVEAAGDVENVFLSVLATLGLNTYLRDKGGEGWDGARRRFARRVSLEFFERDGQECISNWCIRFQQEEISVCAKVQLHVLRSVRDLENLRFFLS